jgi:hypothetical protein
VKRANKLRATAIVLAGAITITACGDDGGDAATTTVADTETTAASDTTAAETETTAEEGTETTAAGESEFEFLSQPQDGVEAFSGTPGEFAASAYTTDLSGVCPDPFIIQKDWLNEAEHAGLYQMIGAGGTQSLGNYIGPLGSTGIQLEILDGGPNLDPTFALPTPGSLYQGNPVQGKTPHLAYVTTDDAVIFSERFPVVNVVSPMRINPQMLMYDPATYGDEGITGLDGVIAAAEDGAQIYVTTKTGSYVRYLIGAGVPEEAFIEGYGGDLDRFVTSGGTLLNQGFVSNEVYTIERLFEQWNQPVRAVLINDLGFEVYPQALSVATEQLETLSPCLELLVPIIQQAQVDYMNDPLEVNTMIAEYNEAGNGADFWKTPLELNQSAVQIMEEFELISNDPGTGALGGIDIARVQGVIDILRPILDGDPAFAENFNPDITAEDIATNEFIDETISFG